MSISAIGLGPAVVSDQLEKLPFNGYALAFDFDVLEQLAAEIFPVVVCENDLNGRACRPFTTPTMSTPTTTITTTPIECCTDGTVLCAACDAELSVFEFCAENPVFNVSIPPRDGCFEDLLPPGSVVISGNKAFPVLTSWHVYGGSTPLQFGAVPELVLAQDPFTEQLPTEFSIVFTFILHPQGAGYLFSKAKPSGMCVSPPSYGMKMMTTTPSFCPCHLLVSF